MSEALEHTNHVNAWMRQAGKRPSQEQLLQLFEEALGALWNRAHVTLGDVTLAAIMDRVLHNAAEHFSPFELLKVKTNGIDCRELRESREIFDGEDLGEGIRFVMVEFLVVIGNLTGEILTQALHSELSKIVLEDTTRDGKRKGGEIMTKKAAIARMATGVQNLDEVLQGGWPTNSVTVIAGPPGSGKTILAQQLCFYNASPKRQVLYFSTLSEPSAKTLRYMSQFTYFDAAKVEKEIHFVDLGGILRSEGLEKVKAAIMQHVKRIKPALVVVDSFKVFDDLAKSREELRKFSYETVVNLMAWETTAFLLGEFGAEEIATNPLFSIADGLVTLSQRESSSEQQRFFQIVKMRGINHSLDEHSFVITDNGIEVYAPRVTVLRKPAKESPAHVVRCRTGVSKLDDLLGDGIPLGSSLLIAGTAGTGKTVLLLGFIYLGALAGEKGIIFSFEETGERLLAAARGLGWNFEREMKRGMIEVVFVPQPSILVERDLLMMRTRIEAMGAKRVGVDSVSVFLHKVKDPLVGREKMFQLASIVQNAQAVGFFATDIPYGSGQISRLGVEETVVDGVILLTSKEEGLDRERYIEIYKLRNTAHLKGRHNLLIERDGIAVFPRYVPDPSAGATPPSVEVSQRLSSGTPGLDELIGGGLLKRSITLVSGSAGIGKSTLSMQFLMAGAKKRERGLYVTLEEGEAQILNTADAMGLPLKEAIKHGYIEILYLARETVRAAQFETILITKIKERKIQRLVLDSASNITAASEGNDELRNLLNKLAVRFKSLDVTSIFTLESKSLFSTETITDRDFSAIADNLFMMRYVTVGGTIRPSFMIVKTRGTRHNRDTHLFEIGEGGLSIAQTSGQTGTPQSDQRPTPKKLGKTLSSK